MAELLSGTDTFLFIEIEGSGGGRTVVDAIDLPNHASALAVGETRCGWQTAPTALCFASNPPVAGSSRPLASVSRPTLWRYDEMRYGLPNTLAPTTSRCCGRSTR
jgi:hypothetical protein